MKPDASSLRAILGTGQAMLFTGAGFSSAAYAVSGETVPSSAEISRDIWNICFPGEEPDDSALQDLFHYAVHHHPKQLEALLRRKLQVHDEVLPPFYARWLQVPWKRVWTLNVDDIELAAARRFRFRRRIHAVSTLTEEFDERMLEDTTSLPVIHLNGTLEGGIHNVTFSTMQYGDRLARTDPWYARFVADLVSHPFVIVGTRLDEAPLWQHLQGGYRQHMNGRRQICRAWIVTSRLTRARQALLEDLGMRWLPMSAEEFSERVLDPPIAPEASHTAAPF